MRGLLNDGSVYQRAAVFGPMIGYHILFSVVQTIVGVNQTKQQDWDLFQVLFFSGVKAKQINHRTVIVVEELLRK